MSNRSSNRVRNPEQSAQIKLPTSTPKLSARELELWKGYFQYPSGPGFCTPSIQLEKKDIRHSQLLEYFKNYHISNQVEITEHDTILHIIRTNHGIRVFTPVRYNNFWSS
ncbi:hypothetical protein BOTCAL_0494g00020 [Botryotinia calthae]|uniref:Uncharacterized protein n=1 Tax=Botryotinia calthae TaxID=38488 RepID=A0A4Y8CMC0_9HELO|nr:hypothetical protein BOTCAL_0494g00020 [Botryotinia calthae]